MKETELAEHFINFFEGFDIYKEVPCNGIIDIVTVGGNIITAIECKCSLNFDVIEQAVKNKAYAHFSYVAVPYTKGRSYALKICRDLGIGVLMCREIGRYFKPGVEIKEFVKPSINRKIRKPKLAEWQKESVAGSQNDRMTAFKNTVREIDRFLSAQRGKPALIKEVLNKIDHHYGSITSAQRSIINLIGRKVIKEFRHEEGYLIKN